MNDTRAPSATFILIETSSDLLAVEQMSLKELSKHVSSMSEEINMLAVDR